MEVLVFKTSVQDSNNVQTVRAALDALNRCTEMELRPAGCR